MKFKNTLGLMVLLVVCVVQGAWAVPDYYEGDSAVYIGSAASGVRPNILFIIDNSGAMKSLGSVEPYDPSTDYSTQLDDTATSYPRFHVYLRNVANENTTNYQSTKFDVDDIVCDAITDVSGTLDEDYYTYTGAELFDNYNEDFTGNGYDDVTTNQHPRYALEQNGFWYGALDTKGKCPSNDNQWENYFTGNYLNYLQASAITYTWSQWLGLDPDTEQLGAVVNPSGTYILDPSDDDYYDVDAGKWVDPSGDNSEEALELLFKCTDIEDGASPSTEPDWTVGSDGYFPGAGTTVIHEGVTWTSLGSVMDMVQYQLEEVIFEQVYEKANMGIMTFGDNNHGGQVVVPITEIDDVQSEDYQKLVAGLSELDDLVNGNTQPVNESFWDAYEYWIGNAGSVAEGISSDNVAYPSPIEYWCQTNHIVLLTTGSNGDSSQTKTLIPKYAGYSADLDEDGEEGEVGDLAKLMYEHLPLDIDGYTPHVQTHVIQLMTEEVDLLRKAAAVGQGQYHIIKNPDELIDALLRIIGGILEANSSFVAPVVPASPDNRAYSGQRIYLGFFKPMNEEPWYGNLKKFGLGTDSRIKGFDSSDNEIDATYLYPDDTDDPNLDGYFLVDADGNPAVRSYWGSSYDGGEVNQGGVGQKLLDRVTSRKIYTRLVSDDLNASGNAFSTSNSELTYTDLDVEDEAEKDSLINFIHGYDAYGLYSDDTTEKRAWIMGDVMHSKPVVLNYSNYTVSDANEVDPDVNKAYIFVGGNDGMLHAFKDATGEEAWAFIPPDLLPNLQYASATDRHVYYVDSSPVIYVYDKDGDGTILPVDLADSGGDGADRAILLCSTRRGGGTSTLTQPVDPSTDPPPSRGSYFALDISDPEDPQFLWQINSEDDGFEELSQTWSLPRLSRMKIGSEEKVVAFFGAGYDTNEDLRFGNTQTFPDTTTPATVTSDGDEGAEETTSTGTSTAFSPRGRGLFAIEVATLSSTDGSPDLADSGSLLWSYTFDDSSSMQSKMTFSVPSDLLLVDRNSDGYLDRIYLVDTGAQLWRFNVADSDPGEWDGTRIFKSNISTADDGRKVFFKPTATVKGDDTFVYFGTGDREHPLNTAVLDRFYMVRDRESGDNHWSYGSDSPLNETYLVDVTENELQDSSVSAADQSAIRSKLVSPYTYDDGAGEKTYYGWYLKLDENAGEKILALPKVVSNVLFFTTYTPAIIDETDDDFDPCQGVLGPSRLYAVDAMTAEAVYNLNTANDTIDDETGEVKDVLDRSDRSLAVGSGIASEPLIIVSKTGAVSVMVGRGGGFFNSGSVGSIDPVFPIYWMKW